MSVKHYWAKIGNICEFIQSNCGQSGHILMGANFVLEIEP